MNRVMTWACALGLVAGALGTAEASVETRPVRWTADGKTFEGLVAFDRARLMKGRSPGVLVVHQWMGPTDYERMRARMLAELGYVAFVADVYGTDLRPTDTASAGKAAALFKGDRALFARRVRASLDQLLAQPEVDASRVAAIGYCFGGTGVIELARTGADLDAAVTFHGGLDSPGPSAGKAIKAKLLLLAGASDPFVKPEDVAALRTELDAAHVTWELVYYSGAVHAFTQEGAGHDPSTGVAYDERADRRSWEAMRSFLAEELAAKPSR